MMRNQLEHIRPNHIAMALSLALFSLAFGQQSAFARSNHCNNQYLDNQAPEIKQVDRAQKVTELCFDGYAAAYSGITRTPLWTAEHLTADRIRKAHSVDDKGDFHAETRLPVAVRSSAATYEKSAYDPGTLAPAEDFTSQQAVAQSFSMANVIPQNCWNNRDIWRWIEGTTRHLALTKGDIYVITGPVFTNEVKDALKDGTRVPTKLFKIIYDPHSHQAAAYVVFNKRTDHFNVVSVAKIEAMTGIDFFPDMPRSVKNTAMHLPVPSSKWK